MFKIACLFAVLAVASVSAKADPKPGVFAYAAPAAYVAAPAAYVAEGSAVYERTFHGNTAPLAYAYAASPYVASPYVASPYVAAAPVAYSSQYVAGAPAQVLLK